MYSFEKWNCMNTMLLFDFTAGCNEEVHLMYILPSRSYRIEKEKITYVATSIPSSHCLGCGLPQFTLGSFGSYLCMYVRGQLA